MIWFLIFLWFVALIFTVEDFRDYRRNPIDYIVRREVYPSYAYEIISFILLSYLIYGVIRFVIWSVEKVL